MMRNVLPTTGRPTLRIKVQGAAPVARVHIIRNDKIVHTTEPGTRDVTLNYTDDDATPGETCSFCFSAEQGDGNPAWGSPRWITLEKSSGP